MGKPSKLIRAADWEDRLATYLDRVREEPFRWGEHDCGHFAAGAIRAMTGVDPAKGFRGKYMDNRGAAEALREHGAGTLRALVVSLLGQPVHPALAKRGDIVMKDRTTLGVCVGLYSYFVGEEHGQAGLVFVPTSHCTEAFSVPFAGGNA